MDINLLQAAINQTKSDINRAVTTATYNGTTWNNGMEAKTALICSETLIQRIHEIVKIGLHKELDKRKIKHSIYPRIGSSSPELDVWGLLKKKKQDVVILFQEPKTETITEGPLVGTEDRLGRKATKNSIVVGVRSQLSSINKNFDTLMERAFAETINLRLRHPELVMSEVYLLIVKEYDEQLMKENRIGYKGRFTNVEKFISIFEGMSHRKDPENILESYKYERSVLLLVDFSKNPAKIYTDHKELILDGIISEKFPINYNHLSPKKYAEDLIEIYMERHSLKR